MSDSSSLVTAGGRISARPESSARSESCDDVGRFRRLRQLSSGRRTAFVPRLGPPRTVRWLTAGPVQYSGGAAVREPAPDLRGIEPPGQRDRRAARKIHGDMADGVPDPVVFRVVQPDPVTRPYSDGFQSMGKCT
ncbi:hypothetical protein GCM10018966_095460 [Streptomyces yanii]